MIRTREFYEKLEYNSPENGGLAPYATKSDTAVRARPEAWDQYSTAFAADSEIIEDLQSFKSLKRKTQVFFSPASEILGTRLTHTLEVVAVAVKISAALGLNIELTKAMALGHDLGHTPFGHSGEKALNILSPAGFKHYEHSVRVATIIEDANLTTQVLAGMRSHSLGAGGFANIKEHETPESAVIELCDKIASTPQDFKDLLKMQAISVEQIPTDPLEALNIDINKTGDFTETFSKAYKDMAVHSVIENSIISDNGNKIKVKIGDAAKFITSELRSFLYEKFTSVRSLELRDEAAKEVAEMVYSFYMKHPDRLEKSALHISMANRNPAGYKMYLEQTSREAQACDAFAFLSDKEVEALCFDINRRSAAKILSFLAQSHN